MPNSPWTETGSSISLVPSTTTIGSDPENVNYLSNQDKINLMAQYTAELAMKTSLDTLASTWSVSSTFYDNAVAGISSGLITAGAPSNWATTWPDGTTSGPWPGIQTSLANLWAQVATQRTALQSSISSAQAAAAQAAAVSAAATDASTKMNTAIADAQSYANGAQAAAISAAATAAANTYAASISAPVMVSTLPILPSNSYPVGKIALLTTTGVLYYSTGSSWTLAGVSGSSIVANSITAGQIAAGAIGATQIAANSITAGNLVVANFDNLIPNPNSEQAAPAGGWPTGAWEGINVTTATSNDGTRCRYISNNYAVAWVKITPLIPCSAGDSFYFEGWAKRDNSQVSAANVAYVQFYDYAGVATGAFATPGTTATWAKLSVAAVAPPGSSYTQIILENDDTGSAGSTYWDTLYFRRMADANLIVDGTITTQKIAAGQITTTLLAANVVTAANIQAGAITANKLAITPIGSTINYDPALSDPTAWTSANVTFSGGPANASGAVGNPYVSSTIQDGYAQSVQAYPIDPTKVYKLSANLFAGAGNNRFMLIYVQFHDVTGASIAGYWSNGSASTGYAVYIGPTASNNAFARYGSQFGAGTALPIPSNAATCNIGIWFQFSQSGSTSIGQAAQDLRLETVVDASLIVDGTITAAKIAAGAITASMITTGTLNATNVAVTNLNASNITTGTLSANMVLFPDGTELSTANRVVTMFKQPSSDNIAVGSGTALIPGLSWPVTVHSGADVFNFFGALTAEQTSGTTNSPVNVYFYVDGVFAGLYPCVPRFPSLNTWYVFPIAATVTGLTTGAHTIAIYANNNGYPFTVKAETRVTCQQIY